jgi:hypothetical protein
MAEAAKSVVAIMMHRVIKLNTGGLKNSQYSGD